MIVFIGVMRLRLYVCMCLCVVMYVYIVDMRLCDVRIACIVVGRV